MLSAIIIFSIISHMLTSKDYLLVFLIGILGALEMLVKKFMLGSVEPLQLITLVSSLNFILVMTILLLSGYSGNMYRILKRKTNKKVLLGLIVFSLLIIAGAYSLSLLAQKENISIVIPMVAVSSTILTFFGGLIVFKEKARIKDFVALILMSMGIYLMGI